MARTCSLACSKAHKDRSGCTGKRRREQFISVDEYTENTMMSDYWLLEGITGVAEGAERRGRVDSRKTWQSKNNQRLVSAAKKAGVALILMSDGTVPASSLCASRLQGQLQLLWTKTTPHDVSSLPVSTRLH